MQDSPRGSGARRTPRTLAGKARPAVNQVQQQSLHQYETALQLMQEGKFEKARVLFEKVSESAAPELLERVRVYVAACERFASRDALTFKSSEEQFDYAVSLLNTGDYEEARDQLESILKKNPSADYAHYGIAILNSITGQAEECLENLARAIQLNPKNRIQARSDSDFQDMTDDPRFTELLYPEIP